MDRLERRKGSGGELVTYGRREQNVSMVGYVRSNIGYV